MPARRRKRLRPDEQRKLLVKAGDVQGLLDHLHELGQGMGGPMAFADLSRAVRRKARKDLPELADDAFALIIGLSTDLLARCTYYIAERLADHGEVRRGVNVPVPPDLEDEGWLTRAERLSRFVAEMASTRARLQHLRELSERHGSQDGSESQALDPLAFRAGKAGSGETAPAEKWKRRRTA